MWKALPLLCLQLLLGVCPIMAQHPYFYNLNEENGLPSNEVYGLLQGPTGHIWIGCSAGLYRYNGTNYKAYANPETNGTGISGLRLAKNGQVWCFNFAGQIFKVTEDSLQLFKDYSKQCKTYPRFTFDNQGRLWISADKSIDVFSPEGKLLKSFPNLKNRKGELLQWSEIEAEPASGYVYIRALNDGLWVSKNLEPPSATTALVPQGSSRSIFRIINNQIIFITEINPKRLYKISTLQRGRVIHETTLDNPGNGELIFGLESDGKGGIMALSSNGALRLNDQFAYTQQTALFSNAKINAMIRDREGSLWFSSLQNGIFVVPNLDLEVFNASNSVINDDNISAIKVLDHEAILLGTYKGLIYRFNPKKNELVPSYNLQISNYRHVRKIKAEAGKLFIARGSFSIVNGTQTSDYPFWHARDFVIHQDTIYLALSDRVIKTWLSGPQKGKIIENIRSNGATAIVRDSASGKVYYACNDGLFCYQNGLSEEIQLNGQPVYATSLQLINQHLWIGTLSKGLLLYHIINQSFDKKLDKTSGLCSQHIRGIIQLHNKVWVTSENCLLQTDTHWKQLRKFGFAEGILSQQINGIDVQEDKIWIATNKGLIRLPAAMESENKVQPLTYIYKAMHKEGPFEAGTILPPSLQDIRFFFEGIALRSRQQFTYQYRLLGKDSSWNSYPGNSNEIRFNSLAPGDYVFELISINEDGIRSQVARFPFGIAKPYWQQWWFLLISGLLILSCFGLIFSLRISFLKKRAEARNELIRSQLTALKAQMNPHFMYNTLNSIQDLIIQQDIKSTNYYLSRFGALMRKILDASEHERILLAEEMEMLETYLSLEKLRFGEQFSYEISITPELEKEQNSIPSMIIQPFVENALKHGLLHKQGQKQLWIRFWLENGLLHCSIRDNGIGREKAAIINSRSHRSFATRATEQRLELLNKVRASQISLEIIDHKDNYGPLGTEIILHFPLDEFHEPR